MVTLNNLDLFVHTMNFQCDTFYFPLLDETKWNKKDGVDLCAAVFRDHMRNSKKSFRHWDRLCRSIIDRTAHVSTEHVLVNVQNEEFDQSDINSLVSVDVSDRGKDSAHRSNKASGIRKKRSKGSRVRRVINAPVAMWREWKDQARSKFSLEKAESNLQQTNKMWSNFLFKLPPDPDNNEEDPPRRENAHIIGGALDMTVKMRIMVITLLY